MKGRQDKAIEAFRGGLNCAQAVLTAYSDELNFDRDFAERVSAGFGGGMGRLQETCGAVTGAFMALGIYYGNQFKENKERKEATYLAIQKFAEKFKTLNGSICCRTLINADLLTGEGQRYIKENKIHATVCEKCIADAINIVDWLIFPKI